MHGGIIAEGDWGELPASALSLSNRILEPGSLFQASRPAERLHKAQQGATFLKHLRRDSRRRMNRCKSSQILHCRLSKHLWSPQPQSLLESACRHRPPKQQYLCTMYICSKRRVWWDMAFAVSGTWNTATSAVRSHSVLSFT